MPAELARLLLAQLAPDAQPADAGDLAARIARDLAAARARWPAAPAPDAAFRAYALERAARQPDLHAALPRFRAEDLVLAWWASSGDARAIGAFEDAHAGDRQRLLARFHRLDAAELAQLLRIKLFVGSETARPRVLDYGGFGFLQNWFKVIAARTFLDQARAHARERTDELDDDTLNALVDAAADPSDATQRAQLHAAVKGALAAAIADLPRRERTFLRHVMVDGLTLERIAATYEVHRVTVARALAAARKQLHEAMRAHVIATLGIAPDALDSAIRALDSQIDLSLARVFREPSE